VTPVVTRKTVRWVALGYVVKTLIVAIAWLAVPDLPQRTLRVVQETWTQIAGD